MDRASNASLSIDEACRMLLLSFFFVVVVFSSFFLFFFLGAVLVVAASCTRSVLRQPVSILHVDDVK